MSEPLFVTKQGEELTQEQLVVKLLQRVSKLEEKVTLNTNVLNEILNQLDD